MNTINENLTLNESEDESDNDELTSLMNIRAYVNNGNKH